MGQLHRSAGIATRTVIGAEIQAADSKELVREALAHVLLLQSLELAGQRRGDKQGGEPAPEIRIDPVASVPHKARGLCVLL
jgi:hypothetical protein